MRRPHPFIPLWALTLACSSPAELCELDVRQSAIKFAQPDAGVAPAAATESVVPIHWQSAAQPEHPSLVCTATRIAPGVYLTARHCVSSEPGLTLVLGSGFEAPAAGCAASRVGAARVTRAVLHPELDLALLVSDEPTPNIVRPAATMLLAREQPRLEERLYIAGFGLTEQLSLGELRALEVTVIGVQAAQVEVQGIAGGACVGDSGGPLYSLEAGHATLLGVLTTGSASCLGADQYVDVANANDWIRDAMRAHQR